MILSCNKYLPVFLKKTILAFVVLMVFNTNTTAQNYSVKSNANSTIINPLLLTAFKQPAKATAMLSERMKPSKYELMYWPNFPLSTAQIEIRDRKWERKNRKTIGGQIVSDVASDIIKTQVNSLVYSKKSPVAVAPRF